MRLYFMHINCKNLQFKQFIDNIANDFFHFYKFYKQKEYKMKM